MDDRKKALICGISGQGGAYLAKWLLNSMNKRNLPTLTKERDNIQ